MDPNNFHIMETVPANIPVVYPVQGYSCPVLWDGTFYHNGAINYAGVEHWHSPIPYSPMPAFSQLVDTYQAHRATFDLSNVMPYRPQFNCNQILRNFISFGDGFPAAYHSQGSCEASANNSVISYGTANHVNFPSVEYNMVDGENLNTGILSPRHDMGALPWTYTNGRLPHSTHPMPIISPLSLMPRQQGHLQHFLPVMRDRIPSVGGQRDSRYVNGNSGKCFQGSVTPPRYFNSSKGGFPHKHQARVSSMGSGNAAFTRIPDEKNSYPSRYGPNKVRTSRTESFTTPRTVLGPGNAAIKRMPNEQNSCRSQYGRNKVQTARTESFTYPRTVMGTSYSNGNRFSGKTARRQWNQLSTGSRVPKTAQHQGNQLLKDSRAPASHAKKRGTQTSLGSHQVWRRKTKFQTSTTPSKPSSERITPKHHITWNGFEEPSKTVGEICQLCDRDFADAPNDYDDSDGEYESDLSNLPSVSVLSCGHAYHSECLQYGTPEEKSRDPSCPLCASFETY